MHPGNSERKALTKAIAAAAPADQAQAQRRVVSVNSNHDRQTNAAAAGSTAAPAHRTRRKTPGTLTKAVESNADASKGSDDAASAVPKAPNL